MNLAELRYAARRILTMRGEEPFRRAASRMRHRMERRALRMDPDAMSLERVYARRDRWLSADPSVDPVESCNRALLRALPARWWQDDEFWKRFAGLYPEQTKQLISRAESVLAGRVQLFQWKEVEVAKPIQWSATMEPGRPNDVWPDSYYCDIDVGHDPERPERDVKWVWELNRFQHLLGLGAAWRLTRDDRFAVEAREHLESWMNAVVYPLGVQWNSNLEVALRALSWARCHILCMNSPSWETDFMARFITCLYIHVVHLEKELTVHHTEGNHLLGEASALYCVSALYPLFSGSDGRLKRSVAILDRLAPRIILPDGVYAEQAFGYFRFVAEFLIEVFHLCPGPDFEPAAVVRERLRKGMAFIRSLTPDAKEIPMMGDSDTGLAIGWRLSDFWDFSPLRATASVVLKQPQPAAGLEGFPAESFLALGEEGPATFTSQAAQAEPWDDVASPCNLFHFPDGGYHVSRDERFNIIFDTGPLGLAPGHGHGHSDGLSFILYYEGKPTIVDPGTLLYNGPSIWRNYFRSTAAHNTVRVDRGDPSEPFGVFRWSKPINIIQEPPTAGEGWTLLRGALNWEKVTHHRFLLHVHGEGVIILDRLDGSGRRQLEWRAHLDPRWNIRPMRFQRSDMHAGANRRWRPSPQPSPGGRRSQEKFPLPRRGRGLGRGGPNEAISLVGQRIGIRRGDRGFTAESGSSRLDIIFSGGLFEDPVVLKGSMEPMGGWYSRYYGSRAPASTLIARADTSLPWNLVTAVKPSGARLSIPSDFPYSLLLLRNKGEDPSEMRALLSKTELCGVARRD